jgi:hypothetical protein
MCKLLVSFKKAGSKWLPDILTIDENPAFTFTQVIETIKETQDCGFPCARFTDKSHRRAFRDFERYPVKSRISNIVRKIDIIYVWVFSDKKNGQRKNAPLTKFNLTIGYNERGCIFLIVNFCGLVQ